MWDNLIAEDPKLKRWFDMKRLEGREEGREEALTEASAGLRGAILSALEMRFPRLANESRGRLENIRSFDALRQLIAEIAVAQDEAAARRAIEAYLQ